MVQVYLDDTEIRLMRHGFGFTGSEEPKPDEGLIKLVEVDDTYWQLVDRGNGYVVYRRKDDQDGNYDAYIRDLQKDFSIPIKLK